MAGLLPSNPLYREIRVASSLERPKAFLLLPPHSRITRNNENHLAALEHMRALGCRQRHAVEVNPPVTDWSKKSQRDDRIVIEFPTMADLELFLLKF